MRYLIPNYLCSYACLCCGKSCMGWNVNVFPKELRDILQALRKLPPEERFSSEAFHIIKEDGKIKEAILTLKDGCCVFLDPGKKCFLHSRFGEAIKPSVCRSYPFYGIVTPEITLIGASLVCTAVLKLIREAPSFKITKTSGNFIPILTLKARYNSQFQIPLYSNAVMTWPAFYRLHDILMTIPEGILESELYKTSMSLSKLQGTVNIDDLEKAMESKEKPFERDDVKLMEDTVRFINLFQNSKQQDRKIAEFEEFLSDLKNHGLSLEPAKLLPWYKEQFKLYKKNMEPLLQKLEENYLRTTLFCSEFYFSKGVVYALNLASTSLELLRLISIVSFKGCKSQDERFIKAMSFVEKYFFHSSKFCKAIQTSF